MTYLEIVNKVLRLMREDTVGSVTAASDVVAELVIDYVNDAKRLVEDAHSWNMLRFEEAFNTIPPSEYVVLTNLGKYARIESIYRANGVALKEANNKYMSYLKANNNNPSDPIYYTVNGTSNDNIRLKLHPTPDSTEALTVSGFKKQPDLAADADVLLVPAQPVVYYAYALAARERGEVGGQTAAEVLSLAGQYLTDAIANDVALNQYDYDWYTV